jgi:hypothetical protein
VSNATHEELNLRSALLGTGLVQPVDSALTRSGKRSSLEVLCRQIPGQEAPWLKIVDGLLEAFESAKVSLHLCRRYLRKNGRMAFGWHLELSGSMSEIKSGVRDAIEVLALARPTLDTPMARPRAARPAAAVREPDLGEEAPGEDLGPVRAPGPPAKVQAPPPGFVPRLRVTRNDVDEETGRPFVVEEMALPHVYREMNKPTEGGRGATKTAGGERPKGRR